ncbi:MAG: endolytic transglycosylase MltG [Betaproteobacteria bacterium]|nr:endolytic transglycosylase MltG [Betaproteobacteria bacterium]
MLSFLKRLLLLAVVAALGSVAYAAWYLGTPIAARAWPAEFRIERGSGLRAATRQIDEAGVTLGRLQFEALGRALGRTQDIKAGSYQLDAPVTPLELLDKLTRGEVTLAELTLIEGWNILQVRHALVAHEHLKKESSGLSDAALLAVVGATETHPEGLFFPDTYLFGKGASDLEVLRRAYRTMHKHLMREWDARDPDLPYRSPYEALIMASVIEKETGLSAERSLIAGALANRLRLGMLLQVDPSVIYGLGAAFDGNLRKRDLLADGPYNTYTRPGLPPTPIAMPGLASLRAALHPAPTDALYYVARGDGSSKFSRNLEEHNRAVQKYQIRK